MKKIITGDVSVLLFTGYLASSSVASIGKYYE